MFQSWIYLLSQTSVKIWCKSEKVCLFISGGSRFVLMQFDPQTQKYKCICTRLFSSVGVSCVFPVAPLTNCYWCNFGPLLSGWRSCGCETKSSAGSQEKIFPVKKKKKKKNQGTSGSSSVLQLRSSTFTGTESSCSEMRKGSEHFCMCDFSIKLHFDLLQELWGLASRIDSPNAP